MAKHLYMGYCPDDSQPDSHDPECEACREERAIKKDAERYRWLRDGKNQDEAFLYVMKDDPVTKYLTGDDVDAVIDAAMNGANAQVQP